MTEIVKMYNIDEIVDQLKQADNETLVACLKEESQRLQRIRDKETPFSKEMHYQRQVIVEIQNEILNRMEK